MGNGSEDGEQQLDIAVVGPCSSGKSTLIARLNSRGLKARSISQEHSYVPYMWQMNKPDILIYLDLSLETLRARRQPNWTAALLDTQKARLAHAHQHADIQIVTDDLTPDQVAEKVLQFLAVYDPARRPPRDEPELLRLMHPD